MENNNATLNSKTYNSDLDATIQVLRGDPAPVQAPAEPEPAAAEKQPVQGQDAADVEDAELPIWSEEQLAAFKALSEKIAQASQFWTEGQKQQITVTAIEQGLDVEKQAALEAMGEGPVALAKVLGPKFFKSVIACVNAAVAFQANGGSFLPLKQTGITREEFWEEIKNLGYADNTWSEMYSTFNGEPVENPLEADTPIRRIVEAIKGRKEKRKRIRQTEIKSDLACVPNCLLVNSLAELIDAGRTWIKPLSTWKEPRQTQVEVSWLAQEDNVEVTGEKFTEADRQVFDALCVPFDNLDFTQQATLSINQIYQLMTDNKNATLSPQQKADVYSALYRLQNIYIRADATVEMKHRKKAPFKIDGRMLSVVDTVELNGTLYFSLGYPPLLKYSKIIGQIVRYDRALLHVLECTRNGEGKWILGKPVQTNERRRTINAYFLRRIAIMNNGIKRANDKYCADLKRRERQAKKKPGGGLPPVKYDWQPELQRIVIDEEFFAKFGIANASDKSKARAYVRDKLLPFYEAMGFIRGSSLITAGKSFRAVTIFPTEKPLKITN